MNPTCACRVVAHAMPNPHLSQIILPKCGKNTRTLDACRCVDKRVAEKDVAVLGTSGLPDVLLKILSVG